MNRLAKYIAQRAKALEILLGLGLVVAGVALESVAAALIVAGAGIIAFNIWSGWRRR